MLVATSLALAWQLHPARLQQVGLTVGRTVTNFDRNSQLTPAINSVYTLLANYNYAKLYRRDGMEVSYLSEALNGLTLRSTDLVAGRYGSGEHAPGRPSGRRGFVTGVPRRG